MKPLIGITSNYIKDSRFGTEAILEERDSSGRPWRTIISRQCVWLAGFP